MNNMIRKAMTGRRLWRATLQRPYGPQFSTIMGRGVAPGNSHGGGVMDITPLPSYRLCTTTPKNALYFTSARRGSNRLFHHSLHRNDKQSPPSIVDIQPSEGDSTKALYADWSKHYEEDIRSMGYDMPEQVASFLVDHGILPPPKDNDNFMILDAGCGDGLSGVALRQVMGDTTCEMIGSDVTPEMLEIAKTRNCYDQVVEMDLNKTLSQWKDNSVDLVSCVGTMTYIEPNGPCLDEFVRIVKPGGYIVYTNRTDRLKGFRPKEMELRDDGKWKLVEAKGPLPYLPGNPDYGKEVEVKIFLYQVLEDKSSNTTFEKTAPTTSSTGAVRSISSWAGHVSPFCSHSNSNANTAKASFSTSASPPDVKIVEVGPRDGLQNEKDSITVEQKLELIHRLQDAGIANLEVGAFVSPKWVPQMADSDKVLLGLEKDDRKKESIQYSVLVPNRKGLASALQHSKMIDEVAIFAAASEEFSQQNINSTIDESMDRFRGVIEDLSEFNNSNTGTREPIRVRGYVSTVVACPYQGMIDPKQVLDVVEQLLNLGCCEISLGDTIGAGTPGTIKAMLEAVLTSASPKQLAMHCHDTYGQALANILVGLEHDIFTIDSSVAGLGGCPYAKGASGNVATEDIVYMLDGMGLSTGINMDALVDAGDYICQVLSGRETGSKAAKAIKAKGSSFAHGRMMESRRSFSTVIARDDEVDTLIIGGGPVGSSTAYHLATQRASSSQEDPSVLIVEQDPSYKSCSAVFSAGGIRIQFSLKENVLMSLYGVDFLCNCKRLLQPSNSDGKEEVDIQYVENGYLMLASSESGKQQLEENLALYREIGCNDMIQLLQPHQLAEKFPWLNIDDLVLGSYGCSGEGWFDPWLLLNGLQKKNKDLGVRYANGRVIGAEIDPHTSKLVSVRVQTHDGNLKDIVVKTVVNAAGARASQVMDLLAGADSPLQHPLPVHPKKRSIYFFHCDTSADECKEFIMPEIAPLTIDSSGAYFRSEGVLPGTGLFLCGMSPPEEVDNDCWDPDELTNADPFLFENQLWPALASRVPAFNCVEVVSSWAGLYEVNVVDRNCILDFHPELTNVLMVNGFSGHGLQHSPAAGRAAAELIDNHNRFATIDLNIFRFDRLLDGGVPVLEKGIY